MKKIIPRENTPRGHAGMTRSMEDEIVMDSIERSTEVGEAEELKSINGTRICVKEAGSGPDLVLIHGRGYKKEGMDAFFNRYKGRFHVLSYDVRCHGKSTDTKAFSLDDCANDLAGLVETCQLDHPQVIGFSMGSYIAMLTAEKHPNMFSKMVLIGTKGSEKGRAVADALPDAEFHIVPYAGHIAWFGNAQAVFAYTDEFLQ